MMGFNDCTILENDAPELLVKVVKSHHILIHSSKGDGQTYRASFFGASQVQPLEAL